MEPHRKKFLKFIAYLQVIGIVLVVFGHSFHEFPDGSNGKSILMYRMMYSFRMPLFMFVSGFLMVFTTISKTAAERLSGPAFILEKAKRLLLPFFVLSLLTFVPRCMMSSMADDPVELSFASLAQSLFFSGSLVIPYFWFLQASFILLSISYIIIGGGNYRGLTLCLSVAFLLLYIFPLDVHGFFALEEVCRLGVYFVLGTVYASFDDAVDRYVPWTSPVAACVFACLWTVSFFMFENTGLIIVCSFMGIMMCISLSKLLEARRLRFLDHLIGANYMIFLLSWYCNVAAQQVLHHYIPSWPWWVFSIMSFFGGIYIPWLCYRYIQGHWDSRWIRLASFLLGQKIRKSS